MATIKAYTDIEQSKKLAEILPHESADMYWDLLSKDKYAKVNNIGHCLGRTCVYAWSLAALLDILPKVINNETLFIETSPALWHIGYRNIYIARADNPVDACVNMIIKLDEQNLL